MRELFEKTARTYISREGLEDLLSVLRKTDFYEAPASTRFHDSEKSGLVKHSLKVFAHALKEPMFDDVSLESIAICTLFHDLCKINYYKVEMRNTKDETGKWVQVPYYTVDDKFPMGHGEKSMYLVNSKLDLTPEEALAIRWHMGGFEAKDSYNTINKCFNENKLAVLTHVCDLKATYIPIEIDNLNL